MVTHHTMYTEFYNLKEQPFSLTPDSHFLFLSTQHRDALGHLLYGIRERKGFMLVSGEVGTGKTTLCRALIHEIDREAEVGFILNSFLSAKELLKAVSEDLGCHRAARTKKELVDEINQFLIEQHHAGRTVVVLIDECQNLAMPVLEQIRMLTNLETEKAKLLQIIMVGQPELMEKLEREELRQLAQRIAVTYHLKPLGYREMVRYINHRLRVASGPDGGTGASPRFSRAALRRIYLYSDGIPRKVNIICDRALLVGYVRGKKAITDGIVRQALEEIRKHPRAARGRRRRSARRRALEMVAAAVCLAAVVGIAYRFMNHGAPDQRVSRSALPPVPHPAKAVSAAQTKDAPVSVAPQPMQAPAIIAPTALLTPEAEAAALLAKMWGIAGPLPDRLHEERDFSALARGCGMKAVSCWADADFLRRMNLPCLLSVRDESGKAFPAVLKSIRDGAAAIVCPGGRGLVIESKKLDARMCGKAVLFVPPDAAMGGVLAPGMEGQAVSDLQAWLREMGWLDVDEKGVYGEETAKAVRRFQADHDLPVDGVAGLNEIVLIFSMKAGKGVPRLAPPGLRS